MKIITKEGEIDCSEKQHIKLVFDDGRRISASPKTIYDAFIEYCKGKEIVSPELPVAEAGVIRELLQEQEEKTKIIKGKVDDLNTAIATLWNEHKIFSVICYPKEPAGRAYSQIEISFHFKDEDTKVFLNPRSI